MMSEIRLSPYVNFQGRGRLAHGPVRHQLDSQYHKRIGRIR